MSLSTESAVRETYRFALRENLKKDLKTEQEFARFAEIEREASERVDAETDGFRNDYQARLTEARDVVMREQSARQLDHPKPSWAVDQTPSPEKIDLLARNRVQADHENRIAAIRADEVDQYRDLQTDCRDRVARAAQAHELRKDHAKEAFETTNQLSPHEAQTRAQALGRSGPTRS